MKKKLRLMKVKEFFKLTLYTTISLSIIFLIYLADLYYPQVPMSYVAMGMVAGAFITKQVVE